MIVMIVIIVVITYDNYNDHSDDSDDNELALTCGDDGDNGSWFNESSTVVQ